MAKILMDGNRAIGEAAIRAGCQCYFGYPITPQNELTEYMAAHLARKKDCAFVQAESEIAAINMVYGASIVGVRAMTSSSSPGISLKQEGISFLAACELPAVIVNMSRGGPGLGSIAAAQSDYFQATRGGGHGDYRTIVLAPSSVQELADLTHRAFDLADKYRIPVIILGDGVLGQMMEPVEFKHEAPARLPLREDALRGAKGRPSRIVKTFTSNPIELEEINWSLFRRYSLIQKEETTYDTFLAGRCQAHRGRLRDRRPDRQGCDQDGAPGGSEGGPAPAHNAVAVSFGEDSGDRGDAENSISFSR